MKDNFKSWLALSLLFSLSTPHLAGAQASGKSDARPKITVRIYDYAEVRGRTLAGAKREATSVLRKAGVETAWLDCYGVNGRKNPACDRSLVATDLVLRVLRPSKATRAALRHNTCGIAVLPKNGGGGTYASVFYDGLEEVAKGQQLPQRLILGHTLAHEIGHLLLGSTGHARHGIMQAVLSSRDWHQAGMGGLRFTARQAKQLRAEVLERVRQPGAEQISRLASPK